jgi:hypothetical protein
VRDSIVVATMSVTFGKAILILLGDYKEALYYHFNDGPFRLRLLPLGMSLRFPI